MLESSDALHRPISIPLNETRPGYFTSGLDNAGRLPGVLWGGGNQWQALRNILMKSDSHFGIDSSHLDTIMKDGVKELIIDLKSFSDVSKL